ncbi:3068_t:CDS:2, partial [Gigaspora rosea]
MKELAVKQQKAHHEMTKDLLYRKTTKGLTVNDERTDLEITKDPPLNDRQPQLQQCFKCDNTSGTQNATTPMTAPRANKY